MAIVVVHFNWAKYNKPVENLFWFLRENSHLPVFGIELSLGDFETKGLDNWIQIHASNDNVCFQKEALINLLVSKLPEEYTNIAWIDHDIYFENKNWYEEAQSALERFDVIQLFEKASWTDIRGKISNSKDCFIKRRHEEIFWNGHMGFAWAAKRKALFNNCGGLYPVCPLGGGDGAFAVAIANRDMDHGDRALALMGLLAEPNYPIYKEWKQRINKNIKSIGYINGTVIHKYHGQIENRKYMERSAIIPDFKPSRDMMFYGGILKFTPGFKRQKQVLQYFLDRKEDE